LEEGEENSAIDIERIILCTYNRHREKSINGQDTENISAFGRNAFCIVSSIVLNFNNIFRPRKEVGLSWVRPRKEARLSWDFRGIQTWQCHGICIWWKQKQ
jgi:hypothetical protein